MARYSLSRQNDSQCSTVLKLFGDTLSVIDGSHKNCEHVPVTELYHHLGTDGVLPASKGCIQTKAAIMMTRSTFKNTLHVLQLFAEKYNI